MTPQHGDTLASALILLAAGMLALTGLFWPALHVWPWSILLFVGWMIAFSRFPR